MPVKKRRKKEGGNLTCRGGLGKAEILWVERDREPIDQGKGRVWTPARGKVEYSQILRALEKSRWR